MKAVFLLELQLSNYALNSLYSTKIAATPASTPPSPKLRPRAVASELLEVVGELEVLVGDPELVVVPDPEPLAAPTT